MRPLAAACYTVEATWTDEAADIGEQARVTGSAGTGEDTGRVTPAAEDAADAVEAAGLFPASTSARSRASARRT